MDVKEKALSDAINRLNAIGAQYKIITADGKEFGALHAIPDPSTKRARRIQRGAGPLEPWKARIAAMKPGDSLDIPMPPGCEPKVMQSLASSWGCKTFGNGNFMTASGEDKLECLRVA